MWFRTLSDVHRERVDGTTAFHGGTNVMSCVLRPPQIVTEIILLGVNTPDSDNLPLRSSYGSGKLGFCV
ncbi:Hypothetical protein SMAX5B_003446 [Scophthalmus maximus]|uniref:Uncharacterized protein n=1 Tax=Scophthalmus maximus TaxID=52904 RepID=A0A2U9CKN2_SCOMX|nr:Hypothetical protein SMAX5B_003446 [Scophthalmus maximus]